MSVTNGSSGLTQQIEARVSVSFLDARTNATSRSKQTPTFVAQFPADFFAPFFYDATSGATPSARLAAGASLFVLPARLLSNAALTARHCFDLIGLSSLFQTSDFAADSVSGESLLQRIARAAPSAAPSLVVYISGLIGLIVPLIARAILSA